MKKAVRVSQSGYIIYVDVFLKNSFSKLEIRYLNDVLTYLSLFPCTVNDSTYLVESTLSFTLMPMSALAYMGESKASYYFTLDKSEFNEGTLQFKKSINSLLSKYEVISSEIIK
jgi:hypothetical protein